MDSNEKGAPRVAVTLNDGQQGSVLVGNAFHTLEDKSVAVFETESIVSLTEYLSKKEDFVVFYDDVSAEAWPNDMDRYSKKIASCICATSPELALIMKCHQQKLTPAELEELLRAIRPCLDEKGKVLLESARVFTISKTTKIEQSKDNAGNFAYHVTRESAKGAGEVEIPKAIKFTVQIFDCCPETMELEFEPRFFWTESKDGVSMTYSFENPRVSIEIRKAKRECIEKYIKDIAAEIHYGSIEVSTQDDSWKYKANPLTDK